MTILHAKTALLPGGWESDVTVQIVDGRIATVASGAAPQGQIFDCLLPAPANLHSHTFQRAMAGMTETRGLGADSFWTWRSLMYRFLDRLTPEDVQAMAPHVLGHRLLPRSDIADRASLGSEITARLREVPV